VEAKETKVIKVKVEEEEETIQIIRVIDLDILVQNNLHR
jgi:phosphoribosyl-dephospho-CoA transferase